jgi:hypothetical protein
LHPRKERKFRSFPPPQHPGFDFSGAEFSGGAVPDPRTFMRDLHQD